VATGLAPVPIGRTTKSCESVVDPIVERPRSHDETSEARPEVGLVDLVDQALVRLDGLRDRPRLSSVVSALLVFLLAVGWGLTRWRTVEPIDDRIPRVEEMVVAGVELTSTDGADPVDSPNTAAPEVGSPAESEAVEATGATEPDSSLVVHVSGAVATEGLVELGGGSRLADAISAAGGATATADVHRLNLATPLVDGMHIRVPEMGEEETTTDRPLIETADTGDNGSGRSSPGSGGADGNPVGPLVDVNRGDLAELQRLPGVGPAIAGAIVAWRDDNGPFASVDDLLDVPGIGPAKLAAIEGQVRL